MQNLKTRRPFTVMQIMSFFYCQVRLTKVQRVDVVFVTGQENTLKSTARAKCGKRTRRKFITCSSLQNIENWLRKSEKNIYVSNRTELQEALAIVRKMVKCGCKRMFWSMQGLKVSLNVHQLCKCNRECETNLELKIYTISVLETEALIYRPY